MQKAEEAQSMPKPFESMDLIAGESLRISSKNRNFLVERCDICDNSISLDVGDVIEGDTWYHESCHKRLQVFGRHQLTEKPPHLR